MVRKLFYILNRGGAGWWESGRIGEGRGWDGWKRECGKRDSQGGGSLHVQNFETFRIFFPIELGQGGKPGAERGRLTPPAHTRTPSINRI